MNKNEMSMESSSQPEKTICFTSYYCNKSFSRSITNIKFNILCKKQKNSLDIINNILNTENDNLDPQHIKLSEKLLPYTWKICIELKHNFNKYSHDDFKQFFANLKPRDKNMNIETDDIVKILILILEKIVPKDFYGCPKNRKAFYNVIRLIMKGMSGQHILTSKLVEKWDINNIPWLESIEDYGKKEFVLTQFLIFIIKNTVCSILSVIFYVTTTRLTHATRKLYYFFKSSWQSASNRYISRLIQKGELVKYPSLSIGSKSKKKIPISARHATRTLLKTTPVLQLILKSNNTIRAIVKYRKRNATEKKTDRTRRNLFKTINPNPNPIKLESKYNSIYKIWSESGKPKLYLVKTDLTDAFGSVDIIALRSILVNLHLKYQRQEKIVERKRLISQEFRKLILEMNKPILVRYGSCVYEWKHGLVQGMRYSPILCEIFYREFDAKYLSHYYDESLNKINFLIRFVDDYLLITDNSNTATNFLNHMIESGKVNIEKTVTNFHYNYSRYINFFGYVFDTDNLEITRDESVYSGQICHRIVFNKSIAQHVKFIKQRIAQTTVPLPALFFNSKINSEVTLLRNVFISLCISANKFCTIIALIYSDDKYFDAESLFKLYKGKVAVKMCDYIVRTMKENKSHDIVFPYCINHFRYLAYKALSLFASKTNICMKLLPYIKTYINKCNCMEGKWNPHYRNIDENGIPIHMAVKEICRRTETKRCLMKFISAPPGFEPYVR